MEGSRLLRSGFKLASVLAISCLLGCSSPGVPTNAGSEAAPNAVASNSATPNKDEALASPSAIQQKSIEVSFGQGMAGVSFGQTSTEVRKLLGKPSEVTNAGFSTYVDFYSSIGVSVAYNTANRVVCLSVSEPEGQSYVVVTAKGKIKLTKRSEVEASFGQVALNDRLEAHYPALNAFFTYDEKGTIISICALDPQTMPMVRKQPAVSGAAAANSTPGQPAPGQPANTK